ncbi:MAG TPA: NAD(P)H-binding protein, partial [Saprospiraceae bacterium]|nr:NAD(P)H-binding protein [Saprospiraceae bacterium]
FVTRLIEADALKPDTLKGICEGQDAVISALGKSVSTFDFSQPGFEAVDLGGNTNVLAEALSAGVKKFVYLSALGAAQLTQLTYFRVHHEFSERLIGSGIDYSIVQPTAIMSAFNDLLKLARRGMLVTIGKGDSLTNPISEADLAKVCVDALDQSFALIPAGGQQVYSRHRINELVMQTVRPGKKVRRLPAGMVRAALPFWRLLDRNLYDKLAFFLEVTQHETLAPKIGPTTFEDWLKNA